MNKNTPEKFWQLFIVMPDGCWNWSRKPNSGGYGEFRLFGKINRVNRLSYRLSYGKFDESLHVLHKCDNRLCGNPTHLFLGTNDDNIRDMISKGRDKKAIGESSGRSKLTENDVFLIRELHKSGLSYKKIAKQFGVYPQAISRAVRGITWNHL
jgi:hypothetical protein